MPKGGIACVWKMVAIGRNGYLALVWLALDWLMLESWIMVDDLLDVHLSRALARSGSAAIL